MRTIKWNDWDRELKGPATYEKYNALAKLHKQYYHNILKSQLITLLVISLLSSIPDPDIQGMKLIQYLILFLIIFYMCLMIMQFRSNYMPKWQKSRFLAESTLSEAWFFAFGFDIYENAEQAKEAFLKRIKYIKAELKMPEIGIVFDTQVESIRSVLNNEFSAWIIDTQSKSMQDKIDFYITNRVENQIKYYSRRAELNSRNSTLYFYTGLVFNVIGITLAILSIGGSVPAYTYIALFTTLSAAFLSWTQTKQHEEVSIKSSVAIDELSSAKDELLILKDTNNLTRVRSKIYEIEKLISREHKVKRNNE
ncbi:SLATT domain-containing protein [Pseudobacter ginsenosidimutans]|uniref:SMODS and SLOG-associating 2TM effector domain-containing protein n=1 Tax=Pseudobacter ginsenosidimutans TaxID=661488 RepID=A0A4Q7N4L9_9BACT|nr:SLATT domain-containing protein [Pseudobacter ginsenosidimutans]QEC44483.1 SLATT domain-containing protein [Pseudobacter ginsenosidimutans]RZS75955.1 hypothetical protein EV199_1831 [Pseudobacter ginsenosidimutans]